MNSRSTNEMPEAAASARSAALYEAILGRSIDDEASRALAANPLATTNAGFGLAMQLYNSAEFVDRQLRLAVDAHLYLIHRARQIMVRRLLPPGQAIIDLGGVNAPLFRMGYAHPFEQMVIVDLPPDERHAAYRNLRFAAPSGGNVTIHYCDMTLLSDFADGSFDLVWSGQSIEHVEPDAAVRMCREAARVLRPGGHFCLDTPNRDVTEIHTNPVGGGFVHPDHRKEYRVGELRDLVCSAGFEVRLERGICEMPRTRATGSFHYDDFVLGNPITDDPRDGYILFLGCQKPG